MKTATERILLLFWSVIAALQLLRGLLNTFDFYAEPSLRHTEYVCFEALPDFFSISVAVEEDRRNIKLNQFWAQEDSNLRPRDYESPALTAEL
jgi:hypothetical protein